MARRLLLLSALVMLAASWIATPTRAADDTIKIGFITSLTGTNARFGEAHQRGYQLAVEEINAKGGVLGKKIELVIEDDASKPEQAQLAVEKLINDKGMNLLIGAYSSASTLQAAAKAEENKVPMIVPTATTNTLTEKGYKYIFRVNATSAGYADTVLGWLKNEAKLTDLAVVWEDTAFGSDNEKEAQRAAKALGIKIVASEKYTAGAADFRPILTRVKSAKPEAIYFLSYLADATLLMQQAKELDLNVKAFTAGGTGFSLPEFPENAKDAAEFTISVNQWTPDVAWTGTKEFTEAFMKKYDGREPQYHSMQAYVSVYVAVDAMKRANTSSDSEKLRDALTKTALDTPFGLIKFNEKGQNNHPLLITQILKGKYITVYPPEVARIKPLFPAPMWSERATYKYPDIPGAK
jgi:branched-chain amino acid transport system substrate-binding protein